MNAGDNKKSAPSKALSPIFVHMRLGLECFRIPGPARALEIFVSKNFLRQAYAKILKIKST